MKNFFLWLAALVSVLSNHIFFKDQTFRKGIPFIESIRYGDFLIQKWFLTIVAISILAGWIFVKRKTVYRGILEYRLYLLVITLVTLIAHFFSFQRWFEFDDYRLIGHHFAVSGTDNYNSMGAVNNPYYGYAFAYLVVRWFEDKFVLYNATGLIVLTLIGFTIFCFSNLIQKNRFISLLVALIFTTSTTYFRQIIQMHEFLGDTFPLLLSSIAIYFSIKKFYPMALIFAAAAMEFGLSREHFIGVPLFLFILFFPSKKLSMNKKIGLALIFPLITFAYLPVFLSFPPQIINRSDWLSNWPQLVRLMDVIFGVTLPHLVIMPMMNFINLVIPNFAYISYFPPLFGLLFIITILALIVLNRTKYKAVKLLIVGLSVIVGSVVFQTLSGIRLEHNLSALHRQYLDFLPGAPTSYGLPAAVGVSILFLGLSQIMKKKQYYVLAMLFVVVNSIGFLVADAEWVKRVSRPQKIVNKQLEGIIPYDGKVKIVFTPHPSEVLSRHVSYFYQLYRIKDPLYETNDPAELVNLINKHKPSGDNIFLLTFDKKTYQVFDSSGLLRDKYPGKIDVEYLDSLSF